jgi:hypothetical protein
MTEKTRFRDQIQNDLQLIRRARQYSTKLVTQSQTTEFVSIEQKLETLLQLVNQFDDRETPSNIPPSPGQPPLASNDPRVQQFDRNMEHFNSILLHLQQHLQKIETQLNAISQPAPNNKPFDKGILKDAVRAYWIFDINKKNSFIELDKAADSVHQSAQFILQDVTRKQIFDQFSQNYKTITLGNNNLSKSQLIFTIVNQLPTLIRNPDFATILREIIVQLIRYCETRIGIITTSYGANAANTTGQNQTTQIYSPIFGQTIQQDLRILQDALVKLDQYINYFSHTQDQNTDVVDNLTKLWQQCNGIDRSNMDAIITTITPIFDHFEELITQGNITQNIADARKPIVDLFCEMVQNFTRANIRMKRTDEYYQITRAIKFIDSQTQRGVRRFLPTEFSALQRCAGELQVALNGANNNSQPSHTTTPQSNPPQTQPPNSNTQTNQKDIELAQEINDLLERVKPISDNINRPGYILRLNNLSPIDDGQFNQIIEQSCNATYNYQGSKTFFQITNKIDEKIIDLNKIIKEEKVIPSYCLQIMRNYNNFLITRMRILIYAQRAILANNINTNLDLIRNEVRYRYSQVFMPQNLHEIIRDGFEKEKVLILQFNSEKNNPTQTARLNQPQKQTTSSPTSPPQSSLTLDENAQAGAIGRKIAELQTICQEFATKSQDIQYKSGQDVEEFFRIQYLRKLRSGHQIYGELTNFGSKQIHGNLNTELQDTIKLYKKTVADSHSIIQSLIVEKLQQNIRQSKVVGYNYSRVIAALKEYFKVYNDVLEQYQKTGDKVYITSELQKNKNFQNIISIIENTKLQNENSSNNPQLGEGKPTTPNQEPEKTLATKALKELLNTVRSTKDIQKLINLFKQIIGTEFDTFPKTGLKSVGLGNILNPTIDDIRYKILEDFESKFKQYSTNTVSPVLEKQTIATELLQFVESLDKKKFTTQENQILQKIIGKQTTISPEEFQQYLAQLREVESHQFGQFLKLVILPNWDNIAQMNVVPNNLISILNKDFVSKVQKYLEGINHNKVRLKSESSLPVIQQIAQKDNIQQVANNIVEYWRQLKTQTAQPKDAKPANTKPQTADDLFAGMNDSDLFPPEDVK